MIRRPPRSTQSRSSAASDVYKRQVDVGNTQTVVGLFDGPDLVGHWRLSSDASSTADEIVIKVDALLGVPGHAWSTVEHVIISSVVPRLTDAWNDAAAKGCGCLLYTSPSPRD